MTWNRKNRSIKLSSTPVFCGIPSKRANIRMTIGTSMKSRASNTDGRKP